MRGVKPLVPGPSGSRHWGGLRSNLLAGSDRRGWLPGPLGAALATRRTLPAARTEVKSWLCRKECGHLWLPQPSAMLHGFGPGRGWCSGRLGGRRVRKRIPMRAGFQVDAVPRVQPAQSAALAKDGYLYAGEPVVLLGTPAPEERPAHRLGSSCLRTGAVGCATSPLRSWSRNSSRRTSASGVVAPWRSLHLLLLARSNTSRSTDARLVAAIVDRATSNAHIIETATSPTDSAPAIPP